MHTVGQGISGTGPATIALLSAASEGAGSFSAAASEGMTSFSAVAQGVGSQAAAVSDGLHAQAGDLAQAAVAGVPAGVLAVLAPGSHAAGAAHADVRQVDELLNGELWMLGAAQAMAVGTVMVRCVGLNHIC